MGEFGLKIANQQGVFKKRGKDKMVFLACIMEEIVFDAKFEGLVRRCLAGDRHIVECICNVEE